MTRESRQYWERILVGNLIASAVVLFAFTGATWRTPVSELARGYLIALLFSTCIAPLVGTVMPRIAPWIWRRTKFPFNWLVITVVMAALAMAGSAAAVGVLVIIGQAQAPDFGKWLEGSLRVAVVLTLTIGLFITAYEVSRARVAQATTQAKLAELESRVQPHFLFNTLNSIAALIHEDPKGAEQMTGQLASLLRSSLDQQATPLVSLDDELRVVRDYLSIEQVRFGDRLRYTIDGAAPTDGARVPRLAVQTLVENSVKYAVSPRRNGAAIRVAVDAAPRRIRVAVEDDGDGFDASELPAGHGLALLRDRLALLFGESASLQIASSAAGTRATITVPETHDVPNAGPRVPRSRAAGCEPQK